MTASPADELVDVVDEHDVVVARATRGEMRAGRLRHRTVMVVVTDGAGRLVVHRRSEAKDVWPGRWDVAAGGVVACGESYERAAHRELAEELGIVVEPSAVAAIGSGSYEDNEVAEIVRVFRVVHPGPFRFADGEVVEARWVDGDQLARLRATAPFVPDSLALVDLDRALSPTARPGGAGVGEPRIAVVQMLEFTVEPFVEGQPGPHVRAAVDAAEAAGGADVEFGPFGSSCSAPAEQMPAIVAAVTQAAFTHGATHVSLHISVGSEP